MQLHAEPAAAVGEMTMEGREQGRIGGEEHRAGAQRRGDEGQAVEHQVRRPREQHLVLDGRGLTFGAVADQDGVPTGPGHRLRDRADLDRRRESRSAAAGERDCVREPTRVGAWQRSPGGEVLDQGRAGDVERAPGPRWGGHGGSPVPVDGDRPAGAQ
jgi:hypothetical protein